MKRQLVATLLAVLPLAARAQVGVGTTTPDSKSALDIRASDKGLLIPRLTAAQRTAITAPPQGLMVYQTDGTASGGPQTGFWYYAGAPAAWVFLSPGGGALTLPYAGTAATNGTVFQITNTGTGGGIFATSGGSDPNAVTLGAFNSGAGAGVYGGASSGVGVLANSGSGPAFAATKSGAQTGRLAQLVDLTSTNDSTALYVSTAGDRPALRAVNTATSAQAAIRGVKQAASTDGIGVEGVITSGATGNAAGVLGNDQSGSGGSSGVIGLTAGGYGVRGIASASGGYGVSGSATDSYGVIGSSSSGVGAYGSSTSGTGVYGASQANATTTAGVQGVGNGGSSAVGVLGTTTSGYGVRGVASASGGYGVQGIATNAYGVTGTSSSGIGTYGISTSSAGVAGVSSSSYGTQGTSTSSSGVYGSTAASGAGLAGVEGTSTNSSGTGVLGTTASGYGVRGEATGSSGYGVIGVASASSGIGVFGSATGAATGLYGVASGTGRAAYFNQNNSSYTGNALEVQSNGLGNTAFFNQSNTGNTANTVAIASVGNTAALKITHPVLPASNSNVAGVLITDPSGYHTAQHRSDGSNLTYNGPGGFSGSSLSDRYGVEAVTNLYEAVSASTSSPDPAVSAVIAQAYSGAYAARFYGSVAVIGSLAKSGGSFKIDHPLDPANQYLYHSFVESPDMMNVYNGNITLDAAGEATVQLPDWFEALNRDFRYQLTPIGAAFTPYVLAKVAGNRFRIAGQPGAEVSWQVTGIRHDKWADANRIPVEQAKEPGNQGRYLHPTLFGQPAARGIGYHPAAAARPAPQAPSASR